MERGLLTTETPSIAAIWKPLAGSPCVGTAWRLSISKRLTARMAKIKKVGGKMKVKMIASPPVLTTTKARMARMKAIAVVMIAAS